MQILYVMSNILIEPRVICQDFNFCNKSTDKSIKDSLKDLPIHVQKVLSGLKQKFSTSQFTSHRKQMDVQNKVSKMVNNSTLKKKVTSKNGIVRFLQLGDLHVDQQYAEVGHILHHQITSCACMHVHKIYTCTVFTV